MEVLQALRSAGYLSWSFWLLESYALYIPKKKLVRLFPELKNKITLGYITDQLFSSNYSPDDSRDDVTVKLLALGRKIFPK